MFQKLAHRHGFGKDELEILYELMEYNEVVIEQAGIIRSKKLNLGLPQGCTLSPVLFNAFIDDICEYIGDEYKDNILLYADDIVIITDDKEIAAGILRVIELHSTDNFYKLNPAKCYVMTNVQETFKIYENEICKMNKIKYLGYIYNLKGLDIDANVEIVKSKIFGRAAMLRRFITSTNILNPTHTNSASIILHAYKVYCRPLLDYPLALMCSFKYMREKCETIQRGILKYVFGFNHRLHTKVLYGILRTEKIEFRGVKLSNSLRIRSESLNEIYAYKNVYGMNNTRIFKFIKSTFEIDKDVRGKKASLAHLAANQIVTEFNITNLENKKKLEYFVKQMNLKIIAIRDQEDSEKTLIEYMKDIINRNSISN